MLSRVAASVPRAACASFAVACVFALMAACGSEPEHPAPPNNVDYPAYGPTSPEELVYFSTVVARVRLLSASADVRNYPPDDDAAPAPAFAFRFRVIEYLKGSGDSELTAKVVAIGRWDFTNVSDKSAALMMAQSRLAERDTRWDDREAVVFLRPSPISAESGVYEFTYRGDWSPGLYSYDIASSQNRAWLHAVAPDEYAAGKGAPAPSEPRYLTGAPAAQSAQTAGGVAADSASPSATSISLSEMKALVAADEEMAAKGKNVPGYEDCLNDKFEFDGLYKVYPPRMTFNEIRILSGQPAGHRLAKPYVRSPAAYYDRWWFAGPDSRLFAIRIANDPDNNPATGYAWEHVALRPIPGGEYKVFVNSQPSAWTPCDYNPKAALNRHETTIIATAPDGVVHEAFFDPVNMKGGAIGADASNGVLDPTDFMFKAVSVSLDSIRWESRAVEMRLSPHTRLANHHADFIAPGRLRRPAAGFRRRIRNGRGRETGAEVESLRPAVERRRPADAARKRKPARSSRRNAGCGMRGYADARCKLSGDSRAFSDAGGFGAFAVRRLYCWKAPSARLGRRIEERRHAEPSRGKCFAGGSRFFRGRVRFRAAGGVRVGTGPCRRTRRRNRCPFLNGGARPDVPQ